MTIKAEGLSILSPGPDRTLFVQRGRTLQYITIAWNSAEFVVALAAGFLAGSIALIGFGFDSAIEVASSLAALWRLGRDHDEESRERTEQRALRLIGACFLLLACYILYESIHDLVARLPPKPSLIGIGLAALSLIVMPWLARLKRRVAIVLESGALEAETRQTEICATLSAILLVGLGLNAGLDWWWADPLAGLCMVPFIAWEGWDAVSGRTCRAHPVL
jgi:divalent metal cation (Fe/Co/Zn/Cd) transporter